MPAHDDTFDSTKREANFTSNVSSVGHSIQGTDRPANASPHGYSHWTTNTCTYASAYKQADFDTHRPTNSSTYANTDKASCNGQAYRAPNFSAKWSPIC